MQISITQKDIEKAKISHSESGMLIDEIAYAIGEPTSDCIYNYNEYIPEPYNFDFEADLLANTKTEKDIATLLRKLNSKALADTKCSDGSGLQAGAFYALNYPEHFNTLLEEYTQAVKYQDNDFSDVISKQYQKEKEEAEANYYDEQYKEWLNGDYSGNYRGVIRHIIKYFELESITYGIKTPTDIIFEVDNEIATQQLEDYNGKKLTQSNYKAYILETIKYQSEARDYKHKQEREKQKVERERLAIYKAEQKAKEDQARIERLSKLTLK